MGTSRPAWTAGTRSSPSSRPSAATSSTIHGCAATLQASTRCWRSRKAWAWAAGATASARAACWPATRTSTRSACPAGPTRRGARVEAPPGHGPEHHPPTGVGHERRVRDQRRDGPRGPSGDRGRETRSAAPPPHPPRPRAPPARPGAARGARGSAPDGFPPMSRRDRPATGKVVERKVRLISVGSSKQEVRTMAMFKAGDIEIDEDGFIQEPDRWNESVAVALAVTEGVNDLTDRHWKLVRYLRDYYLKFGGAPLIRKLCKDTGFKLNEVYEMFPTGPAQGACKVAGLPKPTGCV